MSSVRRGFVVSLFVAVLLCGFAGSARQTATPIVVLISVDGYRWDYISRPQALHLQALARRGVRAEALIPVFPSKTFPNHYSIVTGLYPENHGIVSNVIADPGFPLRFTMSAPTARDGRWWGGEPIWATAIRQQRRAAAMFWPGSEAPIGGVRPTYWRPFDDRVSNADRVRQVLAWLAQPDGTRPSFLTLYFSEVDHAGHRYGPDSPRVLEAVRHVDAALGQLVSGIRALNLLDRTTLVVVSDHGMSPLSRNRQIFLDDYLDLSTVDVVEWSPNVGLLPRSGSVEEVYRALKDQHPSLAVYKREEIPAHLHYRRSGRIPPVVGLADDGWAITTRARHALTSAAGLGDGGGHGYDPRHTSMHGIFVAAGPRVRAGLVVPPFENVHIYNFLCELLGLTPAKNDGDAGETRGFLR